MVLREIGGGNYSSRTEFQGELKKIDCQRRGVITLLKADCWVGGGGVGWAWVVRLEVGVVVSATCES